MNWNVKKIAFAVLALLGLAGVAWADGIFPGFDSATSLTGVETWPMDTHLTSGRGPQTYSVTPVIMKNYVFGNTAAGTATASSGAATMNAGRGIVTSEALTTAAGATYTLTLTDSAIAATSVIHANVGYGTSTTGMPTVANVVPAAGSATIVVQNIHASAALNGTIKIYVSVVN